MAEMPAASAASTDARQRVQHALAEAVRSEASDVHLEPVAAGYELRLRADGLLRTVARIDAAAGRAMVSRLMVMAQLLTYRLDIPQEGRLSIALPEVGRTLDARLAVMPTTHGLRAVVRMPAELLQPRTLDDLALGERALADLYAYARADQGLLLLTGPAGSGKTTTIYALLTHLAAAHAGLSIVSLEDPVERDVPGATQIEVSPFGELTYERALRSILRQDPQVLVLGEIRDRLTALLAVQAAMSGHRLISTLHAGTPGGAIVRLLDMGVEPYQIASSLYGVVSLRLLRRRDGEGYRGRVPAAESATMDEDLRRALLDEKSVGAQALDALIAGRPGHRTLRQAAAELVEAGVTDAAELDRVLGPG